MRRWKRNDEWCVMDCDRHYQFKLIFIRVEWFPHHRTFKRNRLRHERENSPISPRSLLFPKSKQDCVYIISSWNKWMREKRTKARKSFTRILIKSRLVHCWYFVQCAILKWIRVVFEYRSRTRKFTISRRKSSTEMRFYQGSESISSFDLINEWWARW